MNKKANIKGRSLALLAMPVLISVLIAGCDEKNSSITPVQDNITDYLQTQADYSVLVSLLEGTTLGNTLSGNTAYTLFAPTNAAFAKLPDGMLEGLTNQQKQEILRYHLISGRIEITAGSYQETRNSVQGDPVYITVDNGGGTVNNSAVVSSKNRSVANGIVHKVDEVLLPDLYGTILDNIRKRYTMESLYNQFVDLELTGILSGGEYISLVIPPAGIYNDLDSWLENEYTQEQKKEMWEYNMVPANLSGMGPVTQTALQTVQGDSLYLTIIQPGQYLFNVYSGINNIPTEVIKSSNGAIYNHASFLLPDKYMGVLTLMDKRYYLSTVRNGFATAKMTGRMYNAIANPDEQFTVFIPANGTEGLENLPADEEELAAVLKYHVLLEKVKAADLQHNQTYTTWLGEEITIIRNGNQVVINGTAVIRLADLEGTNGVVHVLDKILTP